MTNLQQKRRSRCTTPGELRAIRRKPLLSPRTGSGTRKATSVGESKDRQRSVQALGCAMTSAIRGGILDIVEFQLDSTELPALGFDSR